MSLEPIRSRPRLWTVLALELGDRLLGVRRRLLVGRLIREARSRAKRGDENRRFLTNLGRGDLREFVKRRRFLAHELSFRLPEVLRRRGRILFQLAEYLLAGRVQLA